MCISNSYLGRMKESTIQLKDGLKVNVIKWHVEQPKAHLLVVHGFAEHAARYDHFAQFLNAREVSVTSYDQRGHGKSEGVRAHVDRFIQFVHDLQEIKQTIEGPIFLMGHSMGGLVVNEYLLTQEVKDVIGVISGSAALEVDPSLSPLLQKLAPIIGYLLPKLKTEKLDISTLTRSPDNLKSYNTDPLNYLEGMRARIAAEMLQTIKKNRLILDKVKLPLLVTHGGGDRIAMPGGSKKLYKDASSEDKTLKLYPGLYHELIHEPEKHEVMSDIAKWILTRA